MGFTIQRIDKQGIVARWWQRVGVLDALEGIIADYIPSRQVCCANSRASACSGVRQERDNSGKDDMMVTVMIALTFR